MLGLVTTLLLGSLSLSAQPASLTLTPKASARLTLVAMDDKGQPLPNAKVRLTTSLGEVSVAKAEGKGRFTARFTPPPEHYPQVALVLAEVESNGQRFHCWLALPLLAQASLEVETKPLATVKVTIGDKTFGPRTANKAGHATVPAVVPPGIPTATVSAVDRAGNTTNKPLPLPGHAFPRIRTWSSVDSASWADAKETSFYVFCVKADGTPLTGPEALGAHATLGKLGGPRATPEGDLELTYRAPGDVGPGADTVTLHAEGTGDVTLAVKVLPGPPTALREELTPDTYVAGTEKPVRIRTFQVDAHGNTVGETPEATLTTEAGKVEHNGSQQSLQVPDVFDGQQTLEVKATLGALRGAGAVKLQSGTAKTATFGHHLGKLRAGHKLTLTLTARDEYGNLASHQRLTVTAEGGGAAHVEEQAPGVYSVSYSIPKNRDGELRLHARVGSAPLGTSDDFSVLPYQRPWGVTAGALVGFGANHQYKMLEERPSVAVRLGSSEAELLAEVQFTQQGGTFTSANADFGNNGDPYATVSVSHVQTFSADLGLRYSLPLTASTSLYALGAVGVSNVNSSLQGVPPPANPPVQTNALFGGAVLRGALGASWHLGPGRLYLQAEYTFMQVTGQQISGNLDTVGAAVGYQFNVY
jgi:hypothetical protein